MTNNNQLTPKIGIYFNMTADDYYSIPYFSRSLAEKVRFSGKEAEYAINNLTSETPAMALGTAIHSMFLEPSDFARKYVKAPSILDKEYFDKKILQTVDDLKPYLETFGLKKTGKKEDLVASLKPYLDPNKIIIWDEIKDNFEIENAQKNRKVLLDEDFRNIENIRNEFNKYQYLPKTIENGRSEVVVIWQDKETGVMCKCRLDYVQPLAITDLKTFSIKDYQTPLLDQLRKKTIWSYYNLQYVIYYEALQNIINEILAGNAEIYGEDDQEWISEFLSNPIKDYFILYVRTQAPYQMLALELRPSEVENAGANSYYSVANDIWRTSIKKYANFLKTGKWLGENEINVLQDQHTPNIMWQMSTED